MTDHQYFVYKSELYSDCQLLIFSELKGLIKKSN